MDFQGPWQFWRGKDRFRLQRALQRKPTINLPTAIGGLGAMLRHLEYAGDRRGIRSGDSSCDRPVIFTGVPGSGSVIVAELAARYLGVSAVDGGNFEFWLADQAIDRWRLYESNYYEELLTQLAALDYFRELLGPGVPQALVVHELKQWITVRSLEGIAMGVLRFAAKQRGQKTLGHHDPSFIDNLPKLLHVLPGCRIIHVIRDPRDVAAALLAEPWGANNAVIAARDWASRVQAARYVGEQLGPESFIEIRYEDLKKDPCRVLSSLMLLVDGEVRQKPILECLKEQAARLSNLPVGIWRGRLSVADVERLEAVARDEMVNSGYLPATGSAELSWASKQWWKLHHRLVQLKNIVEGRLYLNGEAYNPRSERPGPGLLRFGRIA